MSFFLLKKCLILLINTYVLKQKMRKSPLPLEMRKINFQNKNEDISFILDRTKLLGMWIGQAYILTMDGHLKLRVQSF